MKTENNLSLDFDYIAVPIKTKTNYEVIKEKISKFYYSNYYLVLLVIFAFVGWQVKIPEISFFSIAMFLTGSIIFTKDLTPSIPGMFLLVNIFPQDVSPEKYVYLALYAMPYFITLIGFLIFNIKKIKSGKYLLPLLAITLAFFLGGLGSGIAPDDYINGLIHGALLNGLVCVVIYLIFYSFCNPKYVDLKVYFAKIMTAVGMLVVFQMISFMFFNPIYAFKDILHAYIQLGTFSCNSVATLLLLTIPFSFYLAIRNPKFSFIYIGFGVLQQFTVLLTYSRGGIVAMLIALPICYIYLIYRSRDYRFITTLSFLAVLGIFFIAYLCCMEEFNYVFDKNVLQRFFGSASVAQAASESGGILDTIDVSRMEIYREAIELFKSFPIFGAGFGHKTQLQLNATIGISYYHSTFFQVIGCLGIFGLILFVYAYYGRLKIVFKNITKSPFNAFVLFAMIGFEAYSMVDTGTMNGMPFMYLVVLMTMVCERENENIAKKEEDLEFAYMHLA